MRPLLRSRVLLALGLSATACGGGEAGHHPAGFAAGPTHGAALKQQAEDCRSCHGEDLTGGVAPDGTAAASCDGCHDPVAPTAWRSDCTFCHGGALNDTGAPPRNLDGTDQVGPFPVHTQHVTGSAVAVAYDCTQCHVKAIDVLSPGHVFDLTPGEAENDFGSGLAPRTQFEPATHTCSNNYCHGTGRGDTGTLVASPNPLPCDGCHATAASAVGAFAAMSGPHAFHLGLAGVGCGDCHQATSADGRSIADRARHIDGQRQVDFGPAVQAEDPSFALDRATVTCTGRCHGYAHAGTGWDGVGGFHPDGYAAASVHGTDMELQRSDCRGCHGDALEGGRGPSCDGCHRQGWRRDCTYCHGGGVDSTGAPPRDLGSSNTSAAQSFVAHTRHVSSRIAPASDCTTCHPKPVDVLSPGHAFDGTPQLAEVTLIGGLSPQGTYAGATGTCASLYCHGNGRATAVGTVTDGVSLTCAGCHPAMNSGEVAFRSMSGDHKEHLPGSTCADCHADVVNDAGTAVTTPALHVDAVRQVRFLQATIRWDPATRRCTGSCHFRNGESKDHQGGEFTW